MANSITHALSYPVRNARYTEMIPYLDADGDPLDPSGPDTEIAKDGGAFADAAEEVTVSAGGRGGGYITFTGAEMDCNAYMAWAGLTTGPKATLLSDRPRDLVSIATGLTAAAGGAASLTMPVGFFGYDIRGCWLRTTGGTGGGGAGGANNQARVITAYDTATRVATVRAWEVATDATTTFDVLLPENWVMFTNVATMASRLIPGAGGSGPVPALGDVCHGTAAGFGADYIQLDAAFSATNDIMVGKTGWLWSATGNGQHTTFEILDWDNTTKRATVDPWLILPSGTVQYVIWSTAPSTASGAALTIVEGFTPAGEAELAAILATGVDNLPTNAELSSALAAADDATLAAIGALNNLSAAGVRTALGMGAANLDAQLNALPTNSELTTALAASDDATLAAIAGLNNLSANQILDSAIEGTLTMRQALILFLAVTCHKSDGFVKGQPSTVHFRNATDTKNRVTATVDVARNRTTVVLDPT